MRFGVALSGGVDSAVAAALLKEAGHRITGYHMIVLPGEAHSTPASEDANRIANHLNIELKVIDLREEFKESIISYFNESYKRGLTPNPCVVCNDVIKFGVLLEEILSQGEEAIATGHYARIVRDERQRYYLGRARSDKKDQAYFLSRIKREKLPLIHFPNGELSKEEVRGKAERLGIPVHGKKDSQEICFIPDDDYRAFLLNCGIEGSEGAIVDTQGEERARHKGLTQYTIGQRKGLGLQTGERLYVKDLDFSSNRLIVGGHDELYSDGLVVYDLNWYIDPESSFDCMCKIRSSMRAIPARVEFLENGRAVISFPERAWAVTPGQLAVLYDEEVVLGSGFIERSGIESAGAT